MPKNGPRWNRENEHGPRCNGCRRAADHAKTQAIVTGAVSCTWTEDGHMATVTRPADKTS